VRDPRNKDWNDVPLPPVPGFYIVGWVGGGVGVVRVNHDGLSVTHGIHDGGRAYEIWRNPREPGEPYGDLDSKAIAEFAASLHVLPVPMPMKKPGIDLQDKIDEYTKRVEEFGKRVDALEAKFEQREVEDSLERFRKIEAYAAEAYAINASAISLTDYSFPTKPNPYRHVCAWHEMPGGAELTCLCGAMMPAPPRKAKAQEGCGKHNSIVVFQPRVSVFFAYPPPRSRVCLCCGSRADGDDVLLHGARS
jgi:hypothetical protein